MTDPREMTIAELAAAMDVTARTIRFYEAEGMISPERRGTQRIFHPRDQVRLKLILRGKRLGFTLAEVRDIIDLYDKEPGEAGQLEFFLDKIAERRADLEQKRRDIDLTLSELGQVEQKCRERLHELGADLRGRAKRTLGEAAE
ncbi:MAG: MerR family DNA-binding transcriptional regulator [Alphaproteobacteria bacterium]